MEPYIAADSVLGWVKTLYLGIPVLCLLVLLALGTVATPQIAISRTKLVLYPLLKIVRKGGRKEFLLKGGLL